MYKEKTVGVVVPAHNEEKLIGRVLDTLPDFVDRVIVVDDASTDRTAAEAEARRARMGERLCVLSLERNRGVGSAIAEGYKLALEEGLDVVAVMAGDAQMDPEELWKVVDPVAEGDVDYSKGNRLFTGQAFRMIPRKRYFGNAFLSLLTKIASGYWHVADSQTGYTAISRLALERLDLDRLYPRYGYPNHLLIMLNVYHFRVKDVSIRPVYGIGEESGIRLWKVIPTLAWLLVKGFFWRMKEKYIIRDFHPLVFFYLTGLLFVPLGFLYMIFIILVRTTVRDIGLSRAAIRFFLSLSTPAALVLDVFVILFGLQMLLFAMWFDMEYNRRLR